MSFLIPRAILQVASFSCAPWVYALRVSQVYPYASSSLDPFLSVASSYLSVVYILDPWGILTDPLDLLERVDRL